MATWHNHSTDELCRALLSLKSEEECYAFLEDICTIKETLDISQRLAVASLLDDGESYAAISKKTGASTATISRISKCYEYGAGGYKTILDRLKAGENK
ncbi:MAG: helix-turn-helix domain-containing protein [Clostridia bacterium]|nr:helix-turn-helix domain-containing protein [Clostridia bacterium]